MNADARSILIVEDDAKIADMMANYLHMHGYQTRIIENGLQAVREVQRMAPALMLLDCQGWTASKSAAKCGASPACPSSW